VVQFASFGLLNVKETRVIFPGTERFSYCIGLDAWASAGTKRTMTEWANFSMKPMGAQEQ
jgi:hypothetical protein